LKQTKSEGSLVGLDADEENLTKAKAQLVQYADQSQFVHANFSQLPDLNLGTFDIILADLGVSSPHFDEPERGFSFRFDGPLDMRFDRSSGETAAKLIDRSSAEDLSRILRNFGEVRQQSRLAQALKESRPQTTQEAFAIIESVAGFRAKSVAPQVFQALRIAVNDELGALEILLNTAPKMLNSGGRLGIISFHSLEDRLVKQTFRTLCSVEKDETTGADIGKAPFELLQRKAIKPSDEEIESNPRARSARLRVLRRCL
ncbi:MAG: 16S rRNA (cytosine(1402)-N(4))-methyltransferase RsmH, partial [Candidatus Peribacteraceae bacterium]|nr:16S rRNA (cytosine(1402)-N(4))-methyltransferase RsmH [Candidatus Peribacteraceae bacterium]